MYNNVEKIHNREGRWAIIVFSELGCQSRNLRLDVEVVEVQ